MRPPSISTLFPYTTLFRSCCHSMGHWLKHTNLIGPAPRSGPLAAIASICSNGTFQWGSARPDGYGRSEEHTSELQSRGHLVCRLLLEKKKKSTTPASPAQH